jgi:hypothetical protein
LQLINPSTAPNELNPTLTPHSILHGDACFAYFNKVWGIPCLPAGPLFAVGNPESAAPHLSKTCPAYNSTPGILTCARDLIRGLRAALDHPKSTLQPNLRTPLRCL